MGFKIVFADEAEKQIQRILDYFVHELESEQAVRNFERDLKRALARLTYLADGLKLCENSRLRDLGYRTIHLRRHGYFMLYKVNGDYVYILGIYHDLQDYEKGLK